MSNDGSFIPVLSLLLGLASGLGSFAVSVVVFLLRGLWAHEMVVVIVAFLLAGPFMIGLGIKNTVHPTARVSQSESVSGFSTSHRNANRFDGVRLVFLGGVFCVLALTGDLMVSLLR